MFSYNSKFYQTVSQILDCIALSFLWIVSSLPIITIGASTTALYYAVDKVIRREEGGIWKEYWKAFRRDFKRATGLWLIMLLVIGILAANFYVAFSPGAVGEQVRVALQIGAVFLTVLMAIWLQCWFPYLARFDDPIKKILKNTLAIMMVETKVAFRLLLLFLLVAAIDVVLSLYVPVLVLLIPVAYIIALNRILERLFARYIAQQEERAQQSDEEKVNP